MSPPTSGCSSILRSEYDGARGGVRNIDVFKLLELGRTVDLKGGIRMEVTGWLLISISKA